MSTELESKRLSLVPFAKEESELFHQINIDPFVRKYLWDDEVIPRSMAYEIMKLNQEQFLSEKCGLWKIIEKGSGEIVGYTGLWYFFGESQPQLLYVVKQAFSGLGFATESAKAIIRYAFEHLNYSYLIAATDKAHDQSQRVTQRLGMQLAEERRENDKLTLFFRIDRAGYYPDKT